MNNIVVNVVVNMPKLVKSYPSDMEIYGETGVWPIPQRLREQFVKVKYE